MFEEKKKAQTMEEFIEAAVRGAVMNAIKQANVDFVESREYMNVKDAAKYLAMSESWLRSNYREEGIPYVQRGRVLFARKHLDEWYESNLQRNDLGKYLKHSASMRGVQDNRVTL
jgi:phage antirepressor YoqD-like protein